MTRARTMQEAGAKDREIADAIGVDERQVRRWRDAGLIGKRRAAYCKLCGIDGALANGLCPECRREGA